MKSDRITIARLTEMLRIDVDTGELFARKATGRHGRHKSGRVVGTATQHGYVAVCVDGARMYAHRVIFAMVTGRWPTLEIDHINGNRSDA
jgi:hypothetical protein